MHGCPASSLFVALGHQAHGQQAGGVNSHDLHRRRQLLSQRLQPVGMRRHREVFCDDQGSPASKPPQRAPASCRQEVRRGRGAGQGWLGSVLGSNGR